MNTKQAPEEALAVGTTDPHLATGFQNPINVQQHASGIKRVLQNIREYGHIIERIRAQIGELAHMHLKSGFPCFGHGRPI